MKAPGYFLSEGGIMGTRKWRPPLLCQSLGQRREAAVVATATCRSRLPLMFLLLFLRLSQLFQEAEADGGATVLLTLITMAAARSG